MMRWDMMRFDEMRYDEMRYDKICWDEIQGLSFNLSEKKFIIVWTVTLLVLKTLNMSDCTI